VPWDRSRAGGQRNAEEDSKTKWAKYFIPDRKRGSYLDSTMHAHLLAFVGDIKIKAHRSDHPGRSKMLSCGQFCAAIAFLVCFLESPALTGVE